MKKRLFIESPSFGFGPISTSLALSKYLVEKYDVNFIASSKALEFLCMSSSLGYYDLDTRNEACFDQIRKFASTDDIFISNTNVEFSTYLLERNYKTVVIDTLYWMWNSIPSIYENHKLFIQQAYYGNPRASFLQKKTCAPIIDYSLWESSEENFYKSDEALLTLGGMEEPGDFSYIIRGSEVLISHITAVLKKHGIKRLHLVGGLTKLIPYINSNGVDLIVHGIVSPIEMVSLTKVCKYIFANPGLTALYELANANCSVFFLPGFNVSQIYQVSALQSALNYKNCVVWEDFEEMQRYFDVSTEHAGLDYLRRYFIDVEKHINNLNIDNKISKYIEDVNDDIIENQLQEVKKLVFGYPKISEILPSMLEGECVYE